MPRALLLLMPFHHMSLYTSTTCPSTLLSTLPSTLPSHRAHQRRHRRRRAPPHGRTAGKPVACPAGGGSPAASIASARRKGSRGIGRRQWGGHQCRHQSRDHGTFTGGGGGRNCSRYSRYNKYNKYNTYNKYSKYTDGNHHGNHHRRRDRTTTRRTDGAGPGGTVVVEPVPTVAGASVVQNNGHGRPARFGAVGRSARTVSFAGGLLYFIVVQVPPLFFFSFFSIVLS